MLSVRLPVNSRLLVVKFVRGESKVLLRFLTVQGVGNCNPLVVQGSTVFKELRCFEDYRWKWKSFSCVWLFASPWTIVHGILQTRILEWVAVPFSKGSSQPRDWSQVSHISGRFFTSWATRIMGDMLLKTHPGLSNSCITLSLTQSSASGAIVVGVILNLFYFINKRLIISRTSVL